MKIIQVCPLYFPSIGGVEEHVRNLSESLAKKHEVTVFTTDNSGLPGEEEVNGVFVRRFRSFSPNNAYHISLDMRKEIRKSRFDIVHGHDYHAFPLFFSRYGNGKKFIVTPHYHRYGVTTFHNFLIRLYRPFGKKIFQDTDSVITCSDYEKDLVIEDFQIESTKIAVIPNGVNLKEFRGLEKKERGHQTILCVARLEEFKGVQYAIEALPLLEESVRLEIVGKGPYKARLISLAKKLGVAHRIDFYQDLRGRELINRYVNADLFMLLSRYESFGITVTEALASKTPCIVANTSALKEWVDNKNCFGIDYPIRSGKLASLITEIMGRKVEDVNLLDWDEVTKQTETVYYA
jgi:glycosyltransferase involved in cell wall biosynthesis